MTGAEITFLSSTMANGRPTFSVRGLREASRAAVLKWKRHDRLAGALDRSRAARRSGPRPTTRTRLSTTTGASALALP